MAIMHKNIIYNLVPFDSLRSLKAFDSFEWSKPEAKPRA